MNRVVTFQEFSELKEWMISNFVTKQDIALLREEITQNFATKQDLERFATKEEVLPRLGRLEQDFAVLKQEVAEFKEETLTRFDRVFGFLEKLDQERIFMHGAILRLEENQILLSNAILRIEEKLSK